MLRVVKQQLSGIWPTLIRIVIIGGVLLCGLGIGRMALRVPQPLILVVIAFLPVGALVLWRQGRLEHGVLGIVLAAATIRFSLPTGTHSRIVMSLAVTAGVLGLWIAGMFIRERELQLKPAPTNTPLLGFIVVAIISYFWSNVFRDVLVVTWSSWPFVQLGGLAVMILLPFAFLLTMNCLDESKWLKWLTGIFVVVGAASFLGTRFGLPVQFLQVRPLFPTCVISLAYAQVLFNRRLSWPVRIMLLLLALGWLYEYLIRQMAWLSGWVPSAVAVAVISIIRSKYSIVLLVILVVVYGALNADSLMARLEAERAISGETRLDAWLHNWRVTGKHWLFGVGPAGYAAYYMSYFPLEAMATHSTYIDILSQTGVVGLAFFLWLFAALLTSNWRLVNGLRGHGDFEESYAVATLGICASVIVSMALGDWIVPFVYTQTIAGFDYAVYSWVLLGGMMSLFHTVQQRENGRSPGEQDHDVTP